MSQYNFVTSYKEKKLIHSNGYKIIKKLGKGTYANVYLTEFYDHTNEQKAAEQLACKIIDILTVPDDFIAKFLPRELHILRKLNHPHIIHVHSIYKKNSKYLIFMRYAERGDLLNFTIQNGAIPESQARIWTRQISLALQYLHELEIAHRDLKCENILITSNLNVKLSDFGFARFVLNKKGLRILSDTYCGSLSYSAPEVVKGTPYNPKVSDIWSLGIVIFAMLNNSMPFEDLTIKKLYEHQLKKKWKFKPNIDNTVSSQVKDLMNNLLEPNVHKRYTISEILNSDWMFMDSRTLGMTEEESLALIKAKEERQKMDENIFSAKNQDKKAA